MNFNPDTTKQVQEVIFSSKFFKKVHSPLLFNTMLVLLENKLKFDDHIK